MIIGLTGGIASGKSTAAKLLGELGAHVIDADKLGHNAYAKGSDAFNSVVSVFGQDTVGDDGEIDRKVLGSKVFGSPESLKKLTDIVWPEGVDIKDKAANQALVQTEICQPAMLTADIALMRLLNLSLIHI